MTPQEKQNTKGVLHFFLHLYTSITAAAKDIKARKECGGNTYETYKNINSI